MNQRELFEPTTQERFERFHAENPAIYDHIVRFSREAVASGFRHFGIWMIWNRMRWHLYIEQDGNEDFKLNNNYTPYYARLVMAQELDLAGLFETRKMKGGEPVLETFEQ